MRDGDSQALSTHRFLALWLEEIKMKVVKRDTGVGSHRETAALQE